MVLPSIVGMQLGVYFYLFSRVVVLGITVLAPVTGHKREILFLSQVSGAMTFFNPFSGSGVYKR
jgi:small basic protein